MNNLRTDNAPSLSVVDPHFIFGALSFLALTIIIILADTDLLGSYFNGRILAVTHLAVLGWATMIIFGALYQLIPVVLETKLISEDLAKITFWFFSSSIILMVWSFWSNDFFSLLPFAAFLLFFAIIMFVVNVLLTAKRAKKSIQAKFIKASVYWLFFTALLGFLIALNFKYNFFSRVHLDFLKVHAHLGLIGWFGLLIIGVSSTLIPMFLISHQLNEKKLTYSFYLVNSGLALLTLDWLIFNGTFMIYMHWLIIASGIVFYFSYVGESYKKRLRKELDLGMKYTMLSVLIMAIPIVISLVVMIGFNFEVELLSRITTLYGFSIIFGLITSIILGQTYKTLPFIIWLFKYKDYVGKFKTPLPRELYSEKIGAIQFYTYFLAIISLTAGLFFNLPVILRAGGYLLLLTALFYNFNIFIIIFHKTKTESL